MAVSPIKRILKGQVLINSAVLVFIALTVLIIYSNIYQSPFIFDDRPGIQENLDIRNVGNYLSFDRLLKPRDIVNLTFALNYRLGKLNVFGYHLVNVLIHIINGFLVYFLAHTIFKQLYLPNIREDDSSARQGLQIQAERRKGKSIRQEFTIFNSNDVLSGGFNFCRPPNPNAGCDLHSTAVRFYSGYVLFSGRLFLFEGKDNTAGGSG